MIPTKKEREVIDRILNHVIKHEKNIFGANSFDRILDLVPGSSKYYVGEVIKFNEDRFNIIKVLNKSANVPSVQANYNTKKFMEAGGFESYFKDRVKVLNRRLLKERNDAILSGFKIIWFWPVAILGAASILYNLLNYPNIKALNDKVKNIEIKLDSVRLNTNDVINKNDSINNSLSDE